MVQGTSLCRNYNIDSIETSGVSMILYQSFIRIGYDFDNITRVEDNMNSLINFGRASDEVFLINQAAAIYIFFITISSLSLISISAIIIIIVVTSELTSRCGRDCYTWLVSSSFITGLLEENSSSGGIGDPFPVTSEGFWASSQRFCVDLVPKFSE
ncbi:transmembrane protein [Arabidopsis thaliana]|uniref:Transmembrane protein n=1 Tax=Arabidopsis thaliana TaxID=3702 RepID=F4HYB6_ARATH|nr:uncharacterized protein AT1G35320 [Arabidopsis thaliana]NP_174765.5 uncharacterized protein AT1G35320 [Arabidopsis thaliana]AEE31778.1 transmembrane protein [Arabidopsis thaliana]ANM60399.1 transmembrane protein [Arabidopsis thaliana]|eukprot:NP_001322689.1 transmembrane protein [Arabidopsis thaliana]